MVGVKPLRLMLLPIVYFILLADVIAINFVADVADHLMLYERMLYMADLITMYAWQML